MDNPNQIHKICRNCGNCIYKANMPGMNNYYCHDDPYGKGVNGFQPGCINWTEKTEERIAS